MDIYSITMPSKVLPLSHLASDDRFTGDRLRVCDMGGPASGQKGQTPAASANG